MGAQAIAFLQERFYNDFKPLPEEELYSFVTGCGCSNGGFYDIWGNSLIGVPSTSFSSLLAAPRSHMKPTQIECSKGSFNQIPAETTVHGDIRRGMAGPPDAH